MLAQHVYSGEGELKGNWKISDLKIEGVNYSNDETGFKSNLYERKKSDGSIEYAYVTAGTDDMKDVKEDVSQPFGITDQVPQSISNAKLISDKLGDNELSYVGHSLGGGLASANAMATGDYGITFNAAGISDATKTKLGLNDSDSWKYIDAYVVSGEIVDFLQRMIGVKAEGSFTPIPNKEYSKARKAKETTEARVNGHLIGTVIKLLRENGMTEHPK